MPTVLTKRTTLRCFLSTLQRTHKCAPSLVLCLPSQQYQYPFDRSSFSSSSSSTTQSSTGQRTNSAEEDSDLSGLTSSSHLHYHRHSSYGTPLPLLAPSIESATVLLSLRTFHISPLGRHMQSLRSPSHLCSLQLTQPDKSSSGSSSPRQCFIRPITHSYQLQRMADSDTVMQRRLGYQSSTPSGLIIRSAAYATLSLGIGAGTTGCNSTHVSSLCSYTECLSGIHKSLSLTCPHSRRAPSQHPAHSVDDMLTRHAHLDGETTTTLSTGSGWCSLNVPRTFTH